MESEVALDFLRCFLEKRGVESVTLKQLPGLLAYGKGEELFARSQDVLGEEEWLKLGDVLWYKVIDDNKGAKKLMKPWRDVITCIRRYRLERQVAASALRQLESLPEDARRLKVGGDYVPIPSSGGPVPLRTYGLSQAGASAIPSAPPRDDIEEESEDEGLEKLDCEVKILTERSRNLEICMRVLSYR